MGTSIRRSRRQRSRRGGGQIQPFSATNLASTASSLTGGSKRKGHKGHKGRKSRRSRRGFFF